MALPVISLTTSVLDFPLRETWIYQPRATNTPTSWTWTNLPPGVFANQTTGAIGGTVTVQGIWVATVQAVNADGASTLMELPISIYAGPWNNRAAVAVNIIAATATFNTSGGTLSVRTDTDTLIDIAFQDATGQLLALNLGALKLVVTHPDTGEILLQSDGTWQPLGHVTERHYEIILSTREEHLSENFLGLAKDVNATISALGQYHFVHAVQTAGNQVTLQNITPAFPVQITRNLLEP